jgi:hypothetical protein
LLSENSAPVLNLPMAETSITLPPTLGMDASVIAANARIELLDYRDQVQKAWDLGPGRWTVGSAPRSTIPIFEEGESDACQLELTVGKRYTSLKATVPVRIAGRDVREWLIDRTTVVELGNRKLVVHPCGQVLLEQNLAPASEEQQFSAVSSSRDFSLDPVSDQPLAPEEDSPREPAYQRHPGSDTVVTDIRQELDTLREVLESMRSQFVAVSDLGARDERIEQLANRPNQISRDELVDLLAEEKACWEGQLHERIDSLESQIFQRLQNWEARLSEITEFISGMATRNDQIVSDSIPDSDVDEIGEEVEESEEENFEENEFVESHVGDSRAGFSSDSDELCEFKVDDESISLRLSRIIGEPREHMSSVRESGSVDRAYSETRETFDDESDSDRVEFAKLKNSLRQTSERKSAVRQDLDQHFSEIEPPIDVKESLTDFPDDSDQDVTKSRAKSQPPESSSPHEEGSGGVSEDESIEEYMQRLLNRVRTGPAAVPSAPAPKVVRKSSIPKSQTVVQEEVSERESVASVASVASAASAASVTSVPVASVPVVKRVNPLATSVPRPPSKPINEAKSDIQALRELANSNARRAINRSEIQRKSSNGVVKIAITVIGLISAGVFFYFNFIDASIRYVGVGVSLIISAVWGFDALRGMFSISSHRKQEKDATTAENESKRPSSKSKGKPKPKSKSRS